MDPVPAWEYLAAVQALSYWAKPTVLQRLEADYLEQKVEHLREAVKAGIGSGAGERLPHELVVGERTVMRTIASWLKENCQHRVKLEAEAWLRTARIPLRGTHNGRSWEIERSTPIPDRHLLQVAGLLVSPKKPDTVGDKITALRLGCNVRTVKNAGERPLRVQMRPIQHHLASLFLDYASTALEGATGSTVAGILDALSMSGYPWICTFYLLEKARNRDARISISLPDADCVRMLCRMAAPAYASGPFSAVTPGQR